jgi:predicted ester cyclase
MTATSPPVNATNADLLWWLFDRLNAHDVASMRAVWTSETVEYFPDATCHGADEIAAYFAEKMQSIENFHLEVITLIASGDDVLVHWHMTGRHTGRLLGIAPTGRSIELDGIDHFVLRNGQVMSNTVVFDQMTFARQLGLLPADGSAADRSLKGAFNAKTAVAARIAGRRSRAGS